MATTYANYENFGTYANEIVNNSTIAYQRVRDLYTTVEELNNPNGWKGVYYDGVVKVFNDVRESFNKTFRSIQEEIPASIRSIASLYASFDTSSVAKAADTFDQIGELAFCNVTALTFNGTNVPAAKDKIHNLLEQATENIVNIKNVMKNMNTDWQGDEYDNIAEKVFYYIGVLEGNLTTIRTNFDNLFGKAYQEYLDTQTKVQSTLDISDRI